MTVERRGTSNTNDRGSAEARRARKNWLLDVFGADVDVVTQEEWIDLVSTLQSEGFQTHHAALIPSGSWYFETQGYGPDQLIFVLKGLGRPACRCFRCGKLVTYETMEVDRIVPGCTKTKRFPNGGTYVRENIRPICPDCNKTISGETVKRRNAKRKKRNEQAKARREAVAARREARAFDDGVTEFDQGAVYPLYI